jgi:hypothetical protein
LEYRTASNVAGQSIPGLVCQNFQQARSMVWLSLDHLSLPSDKSLKQQKIAADIQSQGYGKDPNVDLATAICLKRCRRRYRQHGGAPSRLCPE